MLLLFFQPKPEPETKKVPVKAASSTKTKLSKKKYGDELNDDEDFLQSLKEPDRVYTAEELDELKKRADLQRDDTNYRMVSDFISAGGEKSLDNINLVTEEEFRDYSFRLHNRLQLLSKSEHYLGFIEEIISGLTKTMNADQVKRMSNTLQVIYAGKQTEEREKKAKPKTKKVIKPQLNQDKKSDYDSFAGEGIVSVEVEAEYDEDNDFM